MPKSKPEPAPDALKRERAGTYRSVDERFTVEQSSSGWMVLDAQQTDGLGLPLTRGPFTTLDDAKAAMAQARAGGTPRATAPEASESRRTPSPKPAAKAATRAARPVLIRELRGTDGDALRRLWKEAGFTSVGDDDRSLARMARRNPGLVLVAVEGTQIVASALGGWDGRRGWIYHVATAKTHRGRGIAGRLLDQIEGALAVLGATKVNAHVRDANEDGQGFWKARGYTASPSRPFGKEL